MMKIGITGGIGSGKSTVCEIFSLLGVPVYAADLRARQLMDSHPDIRATLTAKFGSDLYKEGTLNRKLLASLIFTNKELLQWVNRAVHPVVAADFAEWCTQFASLPYILHEAAILFESGMQIHFNPIIVVDAPFETRIERVMQRDGSTREEILARMQNQMDDEERRSKADYLICNDDMHLLIPQVLRLHTLFCQTSQAR